MSDFPRYFHEDDDGVAEHWVMSYRLHSDCLEELFDEDWSDHEGDSSSSVHGVLGDGSRVLPDCARSPRTQNNWRGRVCQRIFGGLSKGVVGKKHKQSDDIAVSSCAIAVMWGECDKCRGGSTSIHDGGYHLHGFGCLAYRRA